MRYAFVLFCLDFFLPVKLVGLPNESFLLPISSCQTVVGLNKFTKKNKKNYQILRRDINVNSRENYLQIIGTIFCVFVRLHK